MKLPLNQSLTHKLPDTLGSALAVQPHRYRLIAARACPWAHRAVIVRRLMGLEDVISMGLAGPTHDKRSWTFDLDPGGVDPALQTPPAGCVLRTLPRLPARHHRADNRGRSKRQSGDERLQLHGPRLPNRVDRIPPPRRPNLLPPKEQREETEAINDLLFRRLNNGVYRAGFSASQDAYEEAYDDEFEVLDWLEDRLANHRFIMGEHITETDIRAYTTLIRFDAVYHGHFKTNRNKITELPNVYGYLCELFQTPGFGDTTDFSEIKQHYYIVHREVNPTRIVPSGPDLSGLAQPHGRDHLPGSPFTPGTTLPDTLPESEKLKNPTDFQRELFGLG